MCELGHRTKTGPSDLDGSGKTTVGSVRVATNRLSPSSAASGVETQPPS